jgi:hypothetical protein
MGTQDVTKERTEAEAQALYVDIDELRRRINPKIGRDRFRAIVREFELRDGFPTKDAMWDGWYWPKVQQWLNKRNEIDDPDAVGVAPDDGPEFVHPPPRRRLRPT